MPGTSTGPPSPLTSGGSVTVAPTTTPTEPGPGPRARVAAAANGVVVILRESEPAYDLAGALQALQRPPSTPGAAPADTGATATLNAQAMVLRTFGVGAQILKDLGVCRMRVMSQPKQMHGLSAFGLTVEAYVGAET